MKAQRLEVTSLRKSSGLLQEALEAFHQGARVALPTECGYFSLGQGDVLLSCSVPEVAEIEELKVIGEIFWPGPLRLRLPGAQSKKSWQLPEHPLARAWLALAETPVCGQLLCNEWGSPVCDPPDWDSGLMLVWKEPCLGLPYSEIDLACNPWRWLRSGWVERRTFEWVTGRSTLLSC